MIFDAVGEGLLRKLFSEKALRIILTRRYEMK
jgi:hypothetical protein